MSSGKKSVTRRVEDLRIAQLAAADETLGKPSQLDILDRFVTPVPALGVGDAARLRSFACARLEYRHVHAAAVQMRVHSA